LVDYCSIRLKSCGITGIPQKFGEEGGKLTDPQGNGGYYIGRGRENILLREGGKGVWQERRFLSQACMTRRKTEKNDRISQRTMAVCPRNVRKVDTLINREKEA